MTIESVWPQFLADKRLRVKPSTLSAYCSLWDSIKSYFGPFKVDGIKTKEIERWCLEELNTHSRKYICDKLTLINNILDFAEYEFEVPVTRINKKNIRWPRKLMTDCEHVKLKTFTQEDLQSIVTSIANNPTPDRLLIAIMVGTGLRIGEASALTYADLDVETGAVKVRKTLERIQIDPQMEFDNSFYESRGYIILRKTKKTVLLLGPTKTLSSVRDVPLPSDLFKVLKKFKSLYPDNFFLGTNRNKPIEPRTLRSSFFRLLADCGISKTITPHGIRHTFASILVTSGTDVRTVAELLGHSDVKTTLDIYSHASVQSKRRAVVNNMSTAFKNLSGNPKKLKS